VTVRATAPFDDNTWASPPATKGAAVPVTATDTGCESWGTQADVTTMLDRARGRGESRLWVELRVPQRHETDLRYGRHLQANEFKLEVTLTNTAPPKPSKTATGNDDTPCAADFTTSADVGAIATLTDPDRNPYDLLTPEFEYWSEADPGTRIPLPYGGTRGGSGTTVYETLPVRDLADGRYAWHVRSFDERAYSPWSDPCSFTVDRTAPATVPTVSSPDYPEKSPTPTGNVNQQGTFLFTANGVADVVAFQYGRSPSDYNRVAADEPGGAATVRWAPRDKGLQTLYVRSIDKAGNRSAERAYQINVRDTSMYMTGGDQQPDPAGGFGMAVGLRFVTQPGNGIATVGYRVDGGAEQSVTVGPDGVGKAVVAPLRAGEHTVTYTPREASGKALYTIENSIFWVTDFPSVTSDGVYPTNGSGGPAGTTGTFTVRPLLAAHATDVQWRAGNGEVQTAAIGADGTATFAWTPGEAGSYYFRVWARYPDGTRSSTASFSVTVTD
jgi:hypothetical protein